MQEISKKPLVDLLSKVTNREVVMSGNQYVYFDTKVSVGASDIESALELQDEEYQLALVSHYKSLYLNVVNEQLEKLDYDNIATVKVWEGDDVFGDEATAILAWYKSIIDTNYSILNDVKDGTRAIPTDEEYLALLPGYGA